MKQALIFLYLILCAEVLVCQTELGLKFGFNPSNTDYGRNEEPANTPGFIQSKNLKSFHFGVTTDFKLKNKFDLAIELFLIGKGSNSRPGNTFALLHTNLAIPVLLKYEVYPNLFLSAGLESNYTLSYYWVEGVNYRNVNELFEDRRKINFGGVLGLGYQFAKKWSLDLRYVRVFRETPDDLFQIYNRTYMFSLHHYFVK
jgi:hypothetical protein